MEPENLLPCWQEVDIWLLYESFPRSPYPHFVFKIHFNIVTWMTKALLDNDWVNMLKRNTRCLNRTNVYSSLLSKSQLANELAR
jgi:hypothetical protein